MTRIEGRSCGWNDRAARTERVTVLVVDENEESVTDIYVHPMKFPPRGPGSAYVMIELVTMKGHH